MSSAVVAVVTSLIAGMVLLIIEYFVIAPTRDRRAARVESGLHSRVDVKVAITQPSPQAASQPAGSQSPDDECVRLMLMGFAVVCIAGALVAYSYVLLGVFIAVSAVLAILLIVAVIQHNRSGFLWTTAEWGALTQGAVFIAASTVTWWVALNREHVGLRDIRRVVSHDPDVSRAPGDWNSVHNLPEVIGSTVEHAHLSGVLYLVVLLAAMIALALGAFEGLMRVTGWHLCLHASRAKPLGSRRAWIADAFLHPRRVNTWVPLVACLGAVFIVLGAPAVIDRVSGIDVARKVNTSQSASTGASS